MKKFISIIIVIVLLLFIPIGSDSVNVYDCEITAHKAVLYTVVQIEAFGFTETKFYFFPANIDANNNLEASKNLVSNISDYLKDVL